MNKEKNKEEIQKKIKDSLIDQKYIGLSYDLNGEDFNGINCITLMKLYLNGHGISVERIEKELRKELKKHIILNILLLNSVLKKDPLKLLNIFLHNGDIVTLNLLNQFDIILFSKENIRNEISHAGIMVNSGWFLHILNDGLGSRLEQMNQYWLNRLYACIRTEEVLKHTQKHRLIIQEEIFT